MPALNAMVDRFAQDIQFLLVYIEEAHPDDGWQMSANMKDDVVYDNPSSFQERTGLAHRCVANLDLKMTAVVDGMDNTTERAYRGWPERLFLVDRDGRIAYKGDPGPFGFHPAELEQAILRVLKKE